MQTISHQVTIMIVDDRPANLNYLIDILSEKGYEIRVFPGGKLALQYAERNPPDLILLDINMPEMDGYEVCKRLKAHQDLKNIPVIFISALTDTQEKIKAFECGGVDYVTKPFELEEVRARVRTHLALAKAELLEEEINKRTRIEQQYYEQLKNLSNAVIHVNQEGIIVYSNPATEKLFGYSSDELNGESVELLVPDELRRMHVESRINFVKSPSGIRKDTIDSLLGKKKNGEVFPVDISLNTLFSEAGILVSAEIKDVSAQRLIEQELEEQRILFEEVFRDTPDALLLTNEENKIIMMNPAVSHMFGYQPAELIGKDPKILYASDDSFETHVDVRDIFLDMDMKQPFITEFRLKNNEVFPGEIIVAPIHDRHGIRTGFLGIVRDISERVKLEKAHESMANQLRQAQKMDALGQLTGGVAHDFNNILASMLGFTELAMDIVAEEETLDKQEVKERFADYLKEVHTAGKRAQDLVEQMLTFSRSGSNGVLAPLELDTLINETIRMLRPVLPASIIISAHIGKSIPLVMANPVQIHQLIMNVCINARDAMTGKGRIEVALAETNISGEVCTACQKPLLGNYLELSVRDTGPGIDSRILDRLFEPFFTTKKIGEGTGMGLAMAHGIVHHHNGHIVVESTPGQGTIFRMFFPVMAETIKLDSSQPDIQSVKQRKIR